MIDQAEAQDSSAQHNKREPDLPAAPGRSLIFFDTFHG